MFRFNFVGGMKTSLMKRKWLARLAGLFGFLFLAGIVWALVGNLKPTEKARSQEVLKVPLNDLIPGKFKLVNWRDSRVLIFRRTQEQIDLLHRTGTVEGLYEWNYLSERSTPLERKDDPWRATLGEYLVVLYDRAQCSLEPVQFGPATIQKQYWVGGFYSPCEDTYFDTSGRLYAEYRDRRIDPMGIHASWSPSMYLEIAPHIREGSTIVLGRGNDF